MALSKVLEAGLEPARPKEHRILSPACLPIPPLEHRRAGDGIRTRDPDLGKVVLYQLSYSRLCIPRKPLFSSTAKIISDFMLGVANLKFFFVLQNT